MKGMIPGRRLMDQEHLQVLAGRWEDLLADLEDEKCTCLEEMAGCLEDRSNREEEMAGREEETGCCDLRPAMRRLRPTIAPTNRANRMCVGKKSLVGLLIFKFAKLKIANSWRGVLFVAW